MIMLAIRAALLSGLGLSLSGCIAAAAAIPVLAGGGMVGSRVLEDDGDEVAEASIPRPPFDRAATEPAPEAKPAAIVEPSADQAPPGLIDEPETLDAAPDAGTSSDLTATAQAAASSAPTTSVGAMPPVQLTLPDGSRIALSGESATGAASAAPSSPPAERAIDTAAYNPLLIYMMMNSDVTDPDDPRRSALLAVPAALEPETSRCAVSQPALMIDLDPGDEPLDTQADYASNRALASVLAEMRRRDVSVHWISGNSAAEAGAIRNLLAKAGLDTQGRDELVLMRYPDDRKQTRRRAVGATHCLIAIAGDERRDFDELYAFLKNPNEAIALERLIGDGWFIIPPALQPADR